MNPRGLLVEDHNGQDFLLTTESRGGMKTHRLVVLQRISGQWQQVTGTEELACRELLIGAFVDFFVDFCRVLNSSGLDRLPVITPSPGHPRTRPRARTKPRRAP